MALSFYKPKEKNFSSESDADDKPIASSRDGGTLTKRETEVGKTFADAERRSSRSTSSRRRSGGGGSSRSSTSQQVSSPDIAQPKQTEPTPEPTPQPTQVQQETVSQPQSSVQFSQTSGGYSAVPGKQPTYVELARSTQEVASRDVGGNETSLLGRKVGLPVQSIAYKLGVASQEAFEKSKATPSIYVDQKTGQLKEGTRINLLSNVEAAKSFSYGFASDVAYGVAFLTTPKQSARDVANIKQAVQTNPTGFAASVGSSIGESFQTNPYGFAGSVSGDFAIARGVSKGGKIATDFATDVYVRTGSDFVPPEKVFAESVLSGKENLPTSTSTVESLNRFRQAKGETGFVVQTSSPSSLKGDFAGSGRKGGVNLEDAGIYVTPAGEGSPYFLRISDDVPKEYQFSINPLKNVGVPTVTRIEVPDVKVAPLSKASQPGFIELNKFYKETGSQTGAAFITKRSQIGQGELPRQSFRATDDFVEGDFNVKQGDIRVEKGTSEIEAVVPVGTELAQKTPKSFVGKVKGFEEFTTFEGRNIAIRETKTIIKDGSNLDLRTGGSSGGGRRVSTTQVVKGQSLVSDITSPTKRLSTGSVLSPGLSKVSGLTSQPGSVSSQVSPRTSSFSFPSSSSSLSYDFSGFSKGSGSTGSSGLGSTGSSGRGSSGSGSSFSFGGSSIGSGISGGASSSKITQYPRFRSLEFEGFKSPKPQSKRKQSRTYTPTLFSVVGNVKAKKRTTLGGLGIRPLDY